MLLRWVYYGWNYYYLYIFYKKKRRMNLPARWLPIAVLIAGHIQIDSHNLRSAVTHR